MLIHFTVTESLYNCNLAVTDSAGTRCFRLDALEDDEINNPHIDIEINSSAFDLILIPEMVDIDSAMNGFEAHDWKSKFAKTTANFMFKAFENCILRVGCTYHIQNVEDDDVIVIDQREYIFGVFDRIDLFELYPMMYMYYEVNCRGNRFELKNAFETNRKQVIKTAKNVCRLNILGEGIFFVLSYPFQIGRVKHLSKNKKIFKILNRFHNMDDTQRAKKIRQMERLFED